jgi:bifunctional non-homologous end joining protein LigD
MGLPPQPRHIVNLFPQRRHDNRRGAALAARPPGAPVSMPLIWPQVKTGLAPQAYTIRTVLALIGKLSAWDGYAESERPLAEAIKRLGKV